MAARYAKKKRRAIKRTRARKNPRSAGFLLAAKTNGGFRFWNGATFAPRNRAQVFSSAAAAGSVGRSIAPRLPYAVQSLHVVGA